MCVCLHLTLLSKLKIFICNVHWLKTETHFGQSSLVICIFFLPSQTWWYKPEAYIHEFWLYNEKNPNRSSKFLQRGNHLSYSECLKHWLTLNKRWNPSLFSNCSNKYLQDSLIFTLFPQCCFQHHMMFFFKSIFYWDFYYSVQFNI